MIDLHTLDRYRITDPRDLAWAEGWAGDGTHGAFLIPSPIDRATMIVIAAADEGWDHVSVSRKNRCPNWTEMSHVHRMFFEPNEVAMQLHVPAKNHVNTHPYCLHLWSPHNSEIPLPPSIFV